MNTITVTIKTNLSPEDVVNRISQWGVVVTPTPTPAVPAGYEVRPVPDWGGIAVVPPGHRLWVIVPQKYPTLSMIFFGRVSTEYMFGKGGRQIWHRNIAIPYCFAATLEEATAGLVKEFTSHPEDYKF